VLLALSLPWSTSLVGIFGVVLHGYADARAEGPGLAEAPDPRDADRVVRSGVCRNPVVLLDLLLFPADDLANWIGLLAGVQNASTSRFNSHISTSKKAGWICGPTRRRRHDATRSGGEVREHPGIAWS